MFQVFQIEVKVKQYKLIQYNKFLVIENYQAFKASDNQLPISLN